MNEIESNYVLLSKELNELNKQMLSENSNIHQHKICNAIICKDCNKLIVTGKIQQKAMCSCGKNGIIGGNSGLSKLIGDNCEWVPAFVISNKNERKKNKKVQEKTMELMNLVNKIEK